MWHRSKRVSIKLERSFKKGRERGVEREEESSLFCVCDKKLNKRGKTLCVDVSFHGSLKLTLSCLYYRLSYVSKQKIMERENAGNNTQVGRGERPLERQCSVTKATIYIFFVFFTCYTPYKKEKKCEFLPELNP